MAPVVVVANQIAGDHRQPGHPERPERVTAVREGVEVSGVSLEWRDADDASDDDLLGVHSPRLITALADHARHGEWFDADTYCTPASPAAARRAAGMAIEVAQVARRGEHGFALCRPPGHHATRDQPMGFCLVNNVAVAASCLVRRGDAERVAIVDIDVHHGNGTQDIFYADPRVLYCSLHEWPLYPGTGAGDECGAGEGVGTTLNCPVPSGTGGDAWLRILDSVVLPAVTAHRPNVILVSCGFDGHRDDPLADLRLDADTYGAAARHLADVAAGLGIGSGWMLEGGYNLDALRESAAAVIAELGA